MNKLIALLLLVFVVSACTWVELTDEGKAIRIVKADAVANCKKTGSILVQLKDKIAGFDRNEDKVKHELETLARNTVVELKMKGDTIAPASKIKDGKQRFDVYRCIAPEAAE